MLRIYVRKGRIWVSQSLEYYMNLNYPIKLRPLSKEEGGGWFAEIPDLPGCMSDGETREEALRNLDDAKETWISTTIKQGSVVSTPSTESVYSGRLTLRLPKTLHRKLAERAEREGVSLNQLILSSLAYELGVSSKGSEQVDLRPSGSSDWARLRVFFKTSNWKRQIPVPWQGIGGPAWFERVK